MIRPALTVGRTRSNTNLKRGMAVPSSMATVTIWGVLGVVLLLIGLPIWFVFTWGDYLIGAAAAFLIVALCQWIWERWTGPTTGEDPEQGAL